MRHKFPDEDELDEREEMGEKMNAVCAGILVGSWVLWHVLITRRLVRHSETKEQWLSNQEAGGDAISSPGGA